MELTDTILVAIISGLVSFGISLITAFFTIKTFKSKFALETEEKYREKLNDLRIEEYPKAFEITGKILFNQETKVNPKILIEIMNELRNWWVGPATILLTDRSVDKYYKLEKLLKKASQKESDINDDFWKNLFVANKEFRKTLKEDFEVFKLKK